MLSGVLDRRAMHMAPFGIAIVVDTAMDRGSVIPNYYVTVTPFVPIDYLGPGRVIMKEGQDYFAFRWRHTFNLRSESFVDEKTLATAFRMGADDRVFHSRSFVQRVAFARGRVGAPTKGVGKQMLGLQPFQHSLHGG